MKESKIKIEPALASPDYSKCSLESIECGGVVTLPHLTRNDSYKPVSAQKTIHQEYTTEQIKQIISVVAEQESIPEEIMQTVAWCESRYNRKEHNYNDPYGGAHGLYQIIFHWHPTVTVACSEDPWCSARYFAKRYKENQGHLWTCYNLYMEGKL